MAATIESSGAIDIICDTDDLIANKNARLIFRTWEDAAPPFQLKVYSPSGSLIVDRVIRRLPTGEPQAAPPITFSVLSGEYRIVVSELRGKARGEATLRVP